MRSSVSTEYDLSELFDKTPDWMCIAGRDGYFRHVNSSVAATLGYSIAELYAFPIHHFIHPEDRKLTAALRENLFRGGTLTNFQNRYLTKEGNVVWLQWTSIYIPEKEIVFALAKDFTERKKEELAIEEKYTKFKNLATHFKYRIEEDRKFLATELHEELAQLVSVVKLDVDWLRTNVSDMSETTKTKIDHALLVSDLLINTIQRISFSISPKMLDDLGLDATLEWHCRDFALLNNMSCNFQSKFNEQHLSKELRMDFFRICQEGLSAAKNHSEAGTVKVLIEDKGEAVALSIMDDGNGEIIDEGKEKKIIKSIRERVASFNGTLEILYNSETGSLIRVTAENPLVPDHFQFPTGENF